jgi:hypothetical protein
VRTIKQPFLGKEGQNQPAAAQQLLQLQTTSNKKKQD